LPELFQYTSQEQQTIFFALLNKALRSKRQLSSREERTLRRKIQKELETHHITQTNRIAHLLVYMGIYDDITPFLPLFSNENGQKILETAYNLILQHHSSANIGNAVDRTSKIVSALKNYARHDEAGQKLKAHILKGIEFVLTLYSHQFQQGIELITHYEDVPAISCYPEKLEQVWTNLIFNAIQAMENEGTLEIIVSKRQKAEGERGVRKLGTWEVGKNGSAEDGSAALHGGENQHSVTSSQYILVQITDSGPGIPKENRERIFEPFFTTKASGEGSGLGLDICRKIIDKHRGKIEVDSQPGKTTFSVWLPVVHDQINSD
jgi:signal transduction histidine kinase